MYGRIGGPPIFPNTLGRDGSNALSRYGSWRMFLDLGYVTLRPNSILLLDSAILTLKSSFCLICSLILFILAVNFIKMKHTHSKSTWSWSVSCVNILVMDECDLNQSIINCIDEPVWVDKIIKCGGELDHSFNPLGICWTYIVLNIIVIVSLTYTLVTGVEEHTTLYLPALCIIFLLIVIFCSVLRVRLKNTWVYFCFISYM